MRVVQITRQFAPAVGGLEEAVLSLSRELRSRHDFDVKVVTLDRVFSERSTPLPPTDVVDGISVRRIPFRGSRRYPIAPHVLASIRDADLVHVHGIDFFFDALALASPLHRKPLVATTHGGFFHTSFAARLKRLYFNTATTWACSAYREIFATSVNDGDIFRKIAGDKVRVVENGVDIGKWAGRASKTPTRRLIYFGRLSSNKRVELLLPLLRELRRGGEDWTLCIAGRADDISFDTLRESAARSGVLDSVTFVSSPSVEDIGGLIGAATYYVSASEHEGFGISAVEAMSAGLIPVLSDIPAFRRFVDQAGIGVLIEPTLASRSASAIQTLHDRIEADLTTQQTAARAASQQFDWSSVSDTIAGSYRRILDKAGR